MEAMKIGLVDADLLDGGTRHPNLALLKIAGFLKDNHIDYELIIESDASIREFDLIYMSRVFTFTKEPRFYTCAPEEVKKKFRRGGTGYYATEKNTKRFREAREKDMSALEEDPYLNSLTNHRGGLRKKGIDMARQMPDYHLYDNYIDFQVSRGVKRERYKDYEFYSIGFLTRRCYRHCPFCVNKLENGVVPYSELEWFHDKSRPHVYFWDDNFLAAPYEIWKPRLQYLIDHKISFQFRQGLDERQLAENEHGEEMACMLAQARYHGDYIFAFDNWRDREIIEKALKIWKRYAPQKGTKFYLFCGYMQSTNDTERFYQDIREIFQRIKVLMQYGCVGYLMRHDDYHNSPLPNLYVQMARWCNQPAFYKKMSFWDFCYRNQSYWEEKSSLDTSRPKLMSYEEVEADIARGYYNQVKMCLPLRTIIKLFDMFPNNKMELLEMFTYRMENLITPNLWKE